MVRYEKEILDYVRKHPGCSRKDIGDAIGDYEAEHVSDRMVKEGKLDRWYTGLMSAYFIVGTHTPLPRERKE